MCRDDRGGVRSRVSDRRFESDATLANRAGGILGKGFGGNRRGDEGHAGIVFRALVMDDAGERSGLVGAICSDLVHGI